MTAIVITGTDTEIGKTVFSAALVRFLDGAYWKPIQSGLEGETDSQTVARLAGLSAERIFPERYRLRTPASPHLAAKVDGVQIYPKELVPPASPRPLIIEGAGGLMVPLDRDTLFIDVFTRWRLPVILCARTRLGTINHTLLSIEALRRRDVPLLGVAFIGESYDENERIIADMGQVTVLGRLPQLDPLEPSGLHQTFAEQFSPESFAAFGKS